MQTLIDAAALMPRAVLRCAQSAMSMSSIFLSPTPRAARALAPMVCRYRHCYFIFKTCANRLDY